MSNKVSTSVQYRVSNIYLFREVFTNWEKFDEELQKGADSMKQYLLNMWNETKKLLMSDSSIDLKDFNKEVTLNDFNVELYKMDDGTPIFLITFPDYDYTDPASKYVALALTKKMPRYFTFEYSKNFFENIPRWVIGEFYVSDQGVAHGNYGHVDVMDKNLFVRSVIKLLENSDT